MSGVRGLLPPRRCADFLGQVEHLIGKTNRVLADRKGTASNVCRAAIR